MPRPTSLADRPIGSFMIQSTILGECISWNLTSQSPAAYLSFAILPFWGCQRAPSREGYTTMHQLTLHVELIYFLFTLMWRCPQALRCIPDRILCTEALEVSMGHVSFLSSDPPPLYSFSVATMTLCRASLCILALATAVAAVGQRGLAYNNATLANEFSSVSGVTWGYNWGYPSNGLDTQFEYVPMLWATPLAISNTSTAGPVRFKLPWLAAASIYSPSTSQISTTSHQRRAATA